MRLDLYLKVSRLVSKRALVKELCEQGAIAINGVRAKAGKGVKEGDFIKIDLWNRRMEVEVVSLPGKNASRAEAHNLYRIIGQEQKPQNYDEFLRKDWRISY